MVQPKKKLQVKASFNLMNEAVLNSGKTAFVSKMLNSYCNTWKPNNKLGWRIFGGLLMIG